MYFLSLHCTVARNAIAQLFINGINLVVVFIYNIKLNFGHVTFFFDYIMQGKLFSRDVNLLWDQQNNYRLTAIVPVLSKVNKNHNW